MLKRIGSRRSIDGWFDIRRHSEVMQSIELWCAVAHQRISRFRIRLFDPWRNDDANENMDAPVKQAHDPSNKRSKRLSNHFRDKGVESRSPLANRKSGRPTVRSLARSSIAKLS
jgi:hypothetical protein